MFRRYEDPVHLEMMLEEEEARLEQMKAEGADDGEIDDQSIYVHELRDRVRAAWEDDEYDSLNASENWLDDLAM